MKVKITKEKNWTCAIRLEIFNSVLVIFFNAALYASLQMTAVTVINRNGKNRSDTIVTVKGLQE